jgi:hypothetical protein
MSDEDREKLMEKRSSLRSWRERGGKMPRNVELIGAGLIAMIFLALIASSFLGTPQATNSSPDQPKKTPVPTPALAPVKASTSLTPVSLPAPSIKINSPENITYNTSTPPLDFIVAGSNLDSVLLSVDGGPSVAVPNDGTVAKIDFAKGSPLFIDDFSGTTKGRWTESGNWRVEGGKYITAGGTSIFGDTGWDDYIVEAKTRIVSGNDVSIDLRWDGSNNHYRVQTSDAYGTLSFHKMDNKGYTTLLTTKLSGIEPANWHTWKIAANGGSFRASIDENPYIDYTDNNKSYLKGKLRLRAMSANVEYNSVQVYKPLLDGTHSLTIFANNTAGNSSSQTIYFTTNTTLIEKNTVGKIGVPVVKGGFEITVKSATPSNQYTSVWLSVKNLENEEQTLKLGPGNIVIDDKGQQYESIKVPKSAELTQTDIYPLAMKEGGVYFDKLSDGNRKLQKLVLYVNGEKLEFKLDAHN